MRVVAAQLLFCWRRDEPICKGHDGLRSKSWQHEGRGAGKDLPPSNTDSALLPFPRRRVLLPASAGQALQKPPELLAVLHLVLPLTQRHCTKMQPTSMSRCPCCAFMRSTTSATHQRLGVAAVSAYWHAMRSMRIACSTTFLAGSYCPFCAFFCATLQSR